MSAARPRRPARVLLTLLALALSFAAATRAANPAEIRAVDLGGLEARSAALLLSGQETGDLEASFLAHPLPATGTAIPLLIVADLPGGPLLEGSGAGALILEVYGYALDGDGQPRATLTRAFRVDPAHRSRLATGGIKLLARLEVPQGAGAATLRLLVLHRASGRFALRSLPLAPAPAPAEVDRALPPLLLEPGDPWLLVRGPGAESGEATAGDGLPATRLVGSAGGTLTLGLAAGASGAPPRARLLAVSGEPLAELDVEAPAAAPGGRRLVVDLSAGAPGRYLLEIATSATGPVTRLPLELVPERLAAGAPWFHRPPAIVEEPPQVGVAPPTAGRSRLAERALTAYLRAFEAWLGGDFEGAAAELRRFEAGAVYSGSGISLSIEEGQVRAAAELVAGDAEALVPLMCLHERLYRHYRRSDEPQLATHSRRLAGEFARLYAERGGREARRIAALVPVSLAGARQEIGARNAALAAYERALELDPAQPEALEGLAALHESFAHYQTTVQLLRRLGRPATLAPAARMRLAVNLGRVGSTEQAIAQLRELVDAEPEWISRLAYQELARLLAGSQRADEALELLTTARQRYPADQGLIIQQAALLDKLGKPLAGQRVLAALDGLTGDPGDSPRLLYSELPSAQITVARARLAGAAEQRLAGVLERSRALRESGPR